MMRIDNDALKVALLVTAIVAGPLVIVGWLQFPGRPVAWVGLASATVMVLLLYYVNLARAERDLANIDAWYRTKTGLLVLRTVYVAVGVLCGIFAFEHGSWLAGILAIAAFASLWKPAG
jgi:hypothetical protein